MKRYLLLMLPAAFITACRPEMKPENSVVIENRLPGTTDWKIDVKFDTCAVPNHRFCRRLQVEGYCSQTSVKKGDTLAFFVSTNPVSEYALDIYRLGFYDGKGGTLKRSISSIQGRVQAEPKPDDKTNFFECNWEKSYELVIPPDWLSGVYLCKLTTLPGRYQSYMIFIVKDNRQADFLFQCSDLTWQAYNRWPYWHSMYDEGHVPWVNTNGARVSFDRPYALYVNELPSGFNPLSNGSGEFLMWEFPLSYWMEKEGYDVTYISNIDTHSDKDGLLRAKGFLSVGHDEYWTYDMFNNVINARDNGVNLMFFSGNSVDGIEYLSPATDNRRYRTTGRLPEREFNNEQELMGSTSWGVGFSSFACGAPDHWFYAKTGMKKGDTIPNLVGWEYHGRPAGHQKDLVILSENKVDPMQFGQGGNNHLATIYTTSKGNFVFNAGTCWWPQPLAHTPAYQHSQRTGKYIVDFSTPDPRVQQMTKNLLDRAISR